MGFGYDIVSWDGHAINDGNPYSADFLSDDSGILDTTGAQAVETNRPRYKPVFAYAQLVSERFSMEVRIDGSLSQSNLDQLKKWFASESGQAYLLVTDSAGEGGNRRRLCLVEKVSVKADAFGNNVFEVQFYSDEYWEDATATTPAATNITASGQTFTLTNPGNVNTPLVLTLTAGAVSSGKQTKVRRCFIANRSREALQHFASEGYPIDITGGGIDTSSGFRSDLADLRVLLYGDYIHRTCYPATANASTKVWCNLYMQPGKFATLAADIDASANSFEVSNPDGFARDDWPVNGWLFVGSEAMQYVGRSTFGSGTLVRPNPTSHSAGDDVVWIEHVPEIIFGDSDSTADDDDADRTPVLDLSQSSNTLHVLTGTFFNGEDRRSGTLLRRVASDGSQLVRCYTDSDGKLRWEHLNAEAGKPSLPVVQWNFPVPLTSLTFDYEVEQLMRLRMTATDADGLANEQLLSFWTSGALSAQTITPALPIYRMEMSGELAVITGVFDPDDLTPVLQEAHTNTRSKRVDNPFFDQVLDQWKRVHEDVDNRSESRGFSVAYYGGQKQKPTGLINYRLQDIVLYTFIRFVIPEQQELKGIVMYTNDWLGQSVPIYTDAGGIPGERIAAVAAPAFGGTGFKMYSFAAVPGGGILGDERTVLPAGVYWLKPPNTSNSFGVYPGFLHPDIWRGYHDVYEDRQQYQVFTFVDFYDFPDVPEDESSDYFHKVAVFGGGSAGSHDITWDEYAEVEVPTEDRYHINLFISTPSFSLLGYDGEPGPNVPRESGMTVTADNLKATLSSDLAPLIFVEEAIDMLLVDGILENETTEQSMELAFVLPLDESLAVDTETGQATAGETGLEAGYAVAFSVPDSRVQLAPGSNTLSYTQSGIADMDIAASFRGRYL